MLHIAARRQGQLPTEPAQFIADMAANFDQVRQGANGAIHLIRQTNRKGDMLVVSLSRQQGDFYQVITAGRFRVGTVEKGKLLWEAERRSNTGDGTTATPLQRGGQSAGSLAAQLRSSNTPLSATADTTGPRMFTPKRETYLNQGSPETLAARAEGELRSRLDAIRRTIGAINREATSGDQQRLREFTSWWNQRDNDLAAFTASMERRAQERAAHTAHEDAAFTSRVDAVLDDTRARLELQLHGLFADEMRFSYLETDAASRRITLWGTQSGTFTGELLRFLVQFKRYPIAFTQRVLGRAVYGFSAGQRGEQTMHLGSIIVLTAVAGYVAMSAKDVLAGRTLRDPTKLNTVLAALVQGGGAGIYGDFLFGHANRFNNTPLENVAGPTLGAAASLVRLAQQVRSGDARGGEALNLALQNTPLVSLWYARPVLDFLILNAARDALSPGFLRRQERRWQEEFGQHSYRPRMAFEF